MHNPVCSGCRTEFRPHRNGVVLVDHASFGPYQIWNADEWICPGCATCIVVGFAKGPEREHFEPDFKQVHDAINSDELRENFERPNPTERQWSILQLLGAKRPA